MVGAPNNEAALAAWGVHATCSPMASLAVPRPIDAGRRAQPGAAGEHQDHEPAPVVRLRGDGRPAHVQLRWSWPGPGGKPVYNFRSEGRRFAQGRCLMPADGLYEFNDHEPSAPQAAAPM